ncbi:MAG: NAD(P)/FAD-dependent oxidoreductase [Desulfomonilaceae bacterium]
MAEKIGVAIIGGGVVGCWIALELSRTQKEIFLFEKNAGITRGENQSSRNSGVNHAGINYDTLTRPLKARFCVEGNRLWHEFCTRYALPYFRVGKIMVATNKKEDEKLDLHLKRSIENRVPGVRRISRKELHELEPNVRAISALLIPTSGVFEPTSLVRQVYFLASNQGVQFMVGTEVIDLAVEGGNPLIKIRYRDGNVDWVKPEKLVNAAGVDAVNLARMVDNNFPLKTALIRGDSMKFRRGARQELEYNGTNIYPTPKTIQTPFGLQHTVGVHLTPMFDYVDGKIQIGDTVMVGPKLTQVKSQHDYITPMVEPGEFIQHTSFFPGLKASDLTPNFGGIQARLNGHPDFFIGRDRGCDKIIHLAGIDSPGFTSAPAIARYVRENFFQTV